MTRSFVTPPATRLYAIGDLHGHRVPAQAMIEAIREDVRGRQIKNVQVVFVGDYIDRGPDSAGMLDDLIALKEGLLPFQFVFLRGNHENGMMKFIDDPEGPRQDWLEWGGIETLQSYGITVNRQIPLREQAVRLALQLDDALPTPHREFLNDLMMYHRSGDYLFVHAGVRPNFTLEEQRERDLLGIRTGFLDYDGLHPWRVVHGHTITERPEILPARINIDTGLYKHGVLSCAVLEGDQVEIMQVRA